MAFDFKKEYREFYLPPKRPVVVDVPAMRYVALRGRGDPNREDGAYRRGLAVLYAVAYTIRMSHKAGHAIEGFFEYVVPPLEGFWWQEGRAGVDYEDKASFCWISAIRLPDFVTKEVFAWAVKEVARKKKLDCSAAEFLTLQEGLCVQMLHCGPFEDEPVSVAAMDAFLAENGYENDFTAERLHHEIYLSDVRKTAPEQWKTVLRHPIRRK